MTTTAVPTTIHRRGGTPAVRARHLSAVALIVLGSLIAVTAAGLIVAIGTDGSVSSGKQSLSTPAAALVSPVATFSGARAVGDVAGRPALRLSATATRAGHGVFVGVGPAAAVDRYLASAAVDRVTDVDLSPWRLTHHVRPGADAPGAPGAQSFWVARATGSTAASVRWDVRDGDYRTVVMNADGTRAVGADGSIAVVMPHLTTITVLAGLAGLLMLGGGIALLATTEARLRRAS